MPDCPVCGESFEKQEELDKHRKEEHSVGEGEGEEEE